MGKAVKTPEQSRAGALGDEQFISRGAQIAAEGAEMDRRQDDLSWRAGDWINGRALSYGDIAAIAERIGMNEVTLRNRRSVAARIPLPRRHAQLSWSHHEAVAALDAAEADRLLAEAGMYSWSVRRIREEAQEASMAAKLQSARAEIEALRAAATAPDAAEAQNRAHRAGRRLKICAAQLRPIYEEMAAIVSDPELLAAVNQMHGNAARAVAPKLDRIMRDGVTQCAPSLARINSALAELSGDPAGEGAGAPNPTDAGQSDAPDTAPDPATNPTDAGRFDAPDTTPDPAANSTDAGQSDAPDTAPDPAAISTDAGRFDAPDTAPDTAANSTDAGQSDTPPGLARSGARSGGRGP